MNASGGGVLVCHCGIWFHSRRRRNFWELDGLPIHGRIAMGLSILGHFKYHHIWPIYVIVCCGRRNATGSSQAKRRDFRVYFIADDFPAHTMVTCEWTYQTGTAMLGETCLFSHNHSCSLVTLVLHGLRPFHPLALACVLLHSIWHPTHTPYPRRFLETIIFE